MKTLFNFIFDNIFLVILIVIGVIAYKDYKELKENIAKIQKVFDKTLTKYIDEKISTAQTETNKLLEEYNREDEVSTEISRMLVVLEKCKEGTINDKVKASNTVNKFKLSKKVNLEKYPNLVKLNEFKTFTDEEINSLDNGLALARQEYNTLAFRYNEQSSGMLQQLIIKITKLPASYVIFDALESQKYERDFEVFQEEEPELNKLSALNFGEEIKIKDEFKNEADSKTSRNDLVNNVMKPTYVVDQHKEDIEDEEEYTTIDTR